VPGWESLLGYCVANSGIKRGWWIPVLKKSESGAGEGRIASSFDRAPSMYQSLDLVTLQKIRA
ncbi:MAG: hypothetical protein KDN20_07745, partial [Verrucomicrobiae bacterium]|nr:hypothetical protein [Verrucomicrobiae bacterium]